MMDREDMFRTFLFVCFSIGLLTKIFLLARKTLVSKQADAHFDY